MLYLILIYASVPSEWFNLTVAVKTLKMCLAIFDIIKYIVVSCIMHACMFYIHIVYAI